MSSKDLQRVTECVSDIGQAFVSRVLPARRHHITQKVKIAGQLTRYVSVHDDEQPGEIFPRLKGPDRSSELIGLYDVVARLMSLALQYVSRLRRWEISSLEPNFPHAGPVVGHDRIKHCTSVPDLIGRHLLVEYCDREELARVRGAN